MTTTIREKTKDDIMACLCDCSNCYFLLEQAKTLHKMLGGFLAPCSKEEVTLGGNTITILRLKPVVKDDRARQLQYEVSVHPTNEVATKTTIIQLLGLNLRLNSFSMWDLDAMLQAIFKCVNNDGRSDIILFQQFLLRFASLLEDMIKDKDSKHTMASVEDQLDDWESWKFISVDDEQLLNFLFPPKKDKVQEPASKKLKTSSNECGDEDLV